jgi:hypothetical protein
VGDAQPFLHAPSVHPRLKDTSTLTVEQRAEASEIEAMQRETSQIAGVGSATNRVLRLCLDAKGFPSPGMFQIVSRLPPRTVLLLERVSEHRRMEIAAAGRITMKYLQAKTRPKPA